MAEPKPGFDHLLIGVLALQGDYEAHKATLERLGASVRLVRKRQELEGLDGIVIPGGESSTFLKFLERDNFLEQLRDFVRSRPAFGTCAGAILLAKEVTNPAQEGLRLMDIAVSRNAYGRQIDSAILTDSTTLPGGPLEMVYIRAPRIDRAGAAVETLASRDGHPVLVREGHMLAATFHPELTDDLRVHGLFLDMVREARENA
jgi:5'-phosphate synthase pdxT subunit